MNKSKVILAVNNLSKSYSSTAILKAIDLELREGEWLAILGESGSGKSTLLKIIGRFLDADEGEVYFENTKLPEVRNKLIPGHDAIKLIHQEFELFPNQTVEENIGYSLRFYEPEYRNEKVEELLNLTSLTHVKQKKAKLLSGGEKQRTAIAKSIAEEPAVLLLDEPFAHLDNHNKRVLASSIERLRTIQKTSCVFVTHEASDALAWSDRIAILRNGEIVQIGTPIEVYTQPVNAYVAELTGDINWLKMDNENPSFIRPEKLRKVKSKEKSKWAGKVTALYFYGNFWKVKCENDEGELTAYRQRPDVAVGDEIYFAFADKDITQI